MKKISKKNKKKFELMLVLLILVELGTYIVFLNINGISNKMYLKLSGKNNVEIELGEKYKDEGITAKYGDINLKDNIKVKNNINENKIGNYKIIYNVKYKKIKKSLVRKVKVVDKIVPTISLVGEDITIVVGNEYKEPGYSALDNYDGDITSNVEVTNNIDKNKVGEYEVNYKISDVSGNVTTAKRVVKVIEKPKTDQKVAVLNYHFFYDDTIGEVCDDGNCIKTRDFKTQLNYLKDNNYKTLTMKEFRDWMYGEIEIPEKSVLITIDDGALGTGTHNGNKLIPILEEYKMHATLFLITGWWSIDNYRSEYLDIESHSNDMHTERFCDGVTRGAKILCLSREEVLNDLKASISITNSKLAFCFPFYAYDNNSINLLKEAGFDLAFIGGGYKATRQTDKYHIPRYQIKQSTTLDTFINYIN